MRRPYPRTPHLPWSPGASADDVRGGDVSGLVGREVVVTEKLDGENTTLYADGSHARSPDSGHHPSRAWVKALQGRVGRLIPYGWRVCGENMYARHSIGYDRLDGFFYGFSVWDDADRCLDWDGTVRFLRRLGIPAPPVLWRGTFDERALRGLRLDTGRQEGYVVRAVDGFAGGEFGLRVAKWVRRGHVRTDTHWMHVAVVPNGLGPAAALWEVRSGGTPDARALSAAVGVGPVGDDTVEGDAVGADAVGADGVGADAVGGDAVGDDMAVAEVVAGLDALGRSGDARLAGVLAVLLRRERRAWLAARLAGPLGMPMARRVADLVGLRDRLWRTYPDEERRGGLVRLSFAADLGVLHAVARACLAGESGADADEAREQVEWSALYAEDTGLLDEGPLETLRSGLRGELGDLDADVADRCWAEARDACADGRIRTAAEAAAATWRWRPGGFPRLIHLIGPSGSGKSTFAERLPGVDARVSLDDLRQARGGRSDQRGNADVLHEGLDRLDAALAKGGTVVWDATSLNRHQRSLVHGVARRRDALITHAVLLVDEDELARRNATRPHPVPSGVLITQLHRFVPPYPGHAHRTWYVGAEGTIDDTDGELHGGEP